MFKRIALPLLAALATALPASAQPPVWVVRDQDSTIVLFGSVHMLPPGLNWRPEALDTAIRDADDLWFELPLNATDSQAAARLAIERGTLPKGQKLVDKLSPSGRRRLEAAARRMNLSIDALNRMRPWLAEVTVGVAQLAGGGANGSDGVERTLNNDAPATAQRRAFETPEQQIAFFADAPEKDQVASLENSLREMEKDPGAYSKLVAAWLAGDTQALEREGLKPMRRASPTLYDRLVVKRNARWTDMIARRLAGSGETVMVVGAAHLIGKDGVPAMLRRRGLHVEGP
ncbi:MAG: TraB/GumN family protein [Ignavibacteriales bacterium]